MIVTRHVLVKTAALHLPGYHNGTCERHLLTPLLKHRQIVFSMVVIRTYILKQCSPNTKKSVTLCRQFIEHALGDFQHPETTYCNVTITHFVHLVQAQMTHLEKTVATNGRGVVEQNAHKTIRQCVIQRIVPAEQTTVVRVKTASQMVARDCAKAMYLGLREQ